MVNRPFNRLSLGCRVTLMVLATITLPGMLIVQTIVARAYYRLNSQSLQLIASMAVKVGAECLPANPRAAVRIADAFARDHGIAPRRDRFHRILFRQQCAHHQARPESSAICGGVRGGIAGP